MTLAMMEEFSASFVLQLKFMDLKKLLHSSINERMKLVILDTVQSHNFYYQDCFIAILETVKLRN